LRALQVITSYATKLALPLTSVLLRLDGLYGNAAPLVDILTAGLGVIARSRDYSLLDLEVVQQALARSPDQVSTHPESGMTRALYDCLAVPLTPTGPKVRLVVATHAAPAPPLKVGVERDGTVYELSFSLYRPRLIFEFATHTFCLLQTAVMRSGASQAHDVSNEVSLLARNAGLVC
jgi:hypothetical protein